MNLKDHFDFDFDLQPLSQYDVFVLLKIMQIQNGTSLSTVFIPCVCVRVKDLKQQNQYQVFERQLDESRCAMMELQRENTALKKQLKER